MMYTGRWQTCIREGYHSLLRRRAATSGASAGVSVGQNDATTRGIYQKGMAVFTVAKGGLMFSTSIAGQKFSYAPRGSN